MARVRVPVERVVLQRKDANAPPLDDERHDGAQYQVGRTKMGRRWVPQVPQGQKMASVQALGNLGPMA